MRTFTKPARAKIIAKPDLISDALPFGQLWYGEPDAISNAIGYAKSYSRSHDVAIRVYDEAGNAILKRTSTRASSESRETWWQRRWNGNARNLDLFIATRAIDGHSRSSLFNGKILAAARTVEAD